MAPENCAQKKCAPKNCAPKNCALTCAPSSSVGTMTMARTCRLGVRPCSASRSHSRCTSGATYARLLPAPVGWASTQSSPSTIGPNASAWARDGRVKPSAAQLSARRCDAPGSASNDAARFEKKWSCTAPSVVIVHSSWWRSGACSGAYVAFARSSFSLVAHASNSS